MSSGCKTDMEVVRPVDRCVCRQTEEESVCLPAADDWRSLRLLLIRVEEKKWEELMVVWVGGGRKGRD